MARIIIVLMAIIVLVLVVLAWPRGEGGEGIAPGTVVVGEVTVSGAPLVSAIELGAGGMRLADAVGSWRLAAVAERSLELDADGDDPQAIPAWLATGVEGDPREGSEPADGLTLVIDAEGGFSERVDGDPDLPWFGSDGRSTDGVVPFDGHVLSNAHGYYLVPADMPAVATPTDVLDTLLRYDDGETMISERIQVIDGLLVRSINVARDGRHLERTVLVYAAVP